MCYMTLQKRSFLFHGTSSNIIPQTLSLKHKSLSKFRLFKMDVSKQA